ncbi:MAG TPA: TMEM165/GDT1 family protein [Acidimicrobiales bacterium]|nr:TMEM165/GDT1 family protein [Acidimicrobiales bacterium]
MNLGAALKAFAAVFPAELPDKTMIATVVLVARYQRPLLVWLGAAAAFTVHVIIAVAAGQLLSLLPDTAVTVATASLFAVGAVILWRESGKTDDAEDELAGGEAGGEAIAARSDLSVVAASFGVIVLAEWGDLTQLATAGIAASTGEPVAVAIGALLALWSVAGLAAALGRTIAARLPVNRLQRGAAFVFGGLALLTLSELL